MDPSSSWYEDPSSLVDELRASCRSRDGIPRIPGYEQVCEISSGGQGVVYAAVQQSTGQRVAIKVLLERAFASASNRRRFEREIEFVATLRHPNIVRIFDSGTTNDGRLYSVMEYIDGCPLDDYLCDCGASGRRPSARELLGLFVKVCDAVHHANQRGVVHRDLKPRNIRIDPNDEPHVLDFGLARDALATPDSLSVTQTGQFVGSFPWASPEQTACFPDGVDVRTDVYSLGVILYHMLTGAFPYQVIGPIRDVLNNIDTKEPKRPSAFDPKIDNELETIVLKCLAKAPERRYQSAGELAADVRHYLAGEPIMAKRDSTSYLLRKNLRKYRWPLTVAAAFVVVLVASSVVAWTFYIEANAGRAEAEKRANELDLQRYYDLIRLAQADYESGSMTSMRSALDQCSLELRQWEWHYLDRLSELSDATLRGHKESIFSVAFSPDSTRIVSTSRDGTVKLWDVASGEEFRTFTGHNGGVMGVKFGLDGTRIISAGVDGFVLVWDAETGRELQVLDGRHGPIDAVAVSPDGKRIVVAHTAGVLQVWDTKTGKQLDTLAGDGAGVHSVAFSPDGHFFASGGERFIQVWDAKSGLEVQRIPEPQLPRHTLAFDGADHLVSGGARNTVKVWDVETGEMLRVLHGHTDTVRAVVCGPNGRWIVSGGDDRTIRVWDAGTGEEAWILRGHTSGIQAVVVSPDGRWIASAGDDRTIRIWHHPACEGGRDDVGSPLLTLKGGAIAPHDQAFAQNGRLHTLTGGAYQIWDPKTGEQNQLRYIGQSYALAVSPDGRQVAFSTAWPVERTHDPPGQLIVCDAMNGRQVWRTGPLPGRAPALTLAYSPDGRHIAVSAADQAQRTTDRYGVDIWDATAEVRVMRLRGHEGEVRSVAYGTSGTRIVSAGEDGTVIVWNAKTGEQELVLRGHAATVRCVRFGPNGRLIVSAGEDGTCRLWNAESGRAIQRFSGHDGIVYSVAFHPGGKRLVSCGEDGAIILWDVRTGKEVLKLCGRGSPVHRVSFSPDGNCLISSGVGDGIRIWETAKPSREILERRYVLAEARYLVDELLVDVAVPTTVVRHLEEKGEYRSLSEPVRRAALHIAHCRSRDATRLEKEAWSFVKDAPEYVDGPTETETRGYCRALQLAEAACEAAPGNIVFLHTLGVAQYRVGQFEKACETLRRTSQRRGEPQDFAFLAMSLYRLGRSEEAELRLKQARAVLDKPTFHVQSHLHRFVQEAESLILLKHPPPEKS